MGDIKLSKEQFTYLKKIQQQEIMFIVNVKDQCVNFLKMLDMLILLML